MPALGSDFSLTSGRTALGFALVEFQLLQPLPEGRLRSFCPLSSRGSRLHTAGSETEGTYNLTLGEILPPLSTGSVKINTNEKFYSAALSKSM